MALLELRSVTKLFGGLRAVADVDLSIEESEIVGLIGPNGAGKTTIFNLLTGVYSPSSGSILFRGKSLNGKKPHEIAECGISRTFQNIRLFPDLSVLENVKAACYMHLRESLGAALMRTNASYDAEQRAMSRALALIERFGLSRYSDEAARNLPYGEQRRLEIARSLATEPELVLLDEPAAGMNPREKVELMERIRLLREEYHVTVLLIEHDMRLVMGCCERIVVLDDGRVIAKGKPDEIKVDPLVIEAYLGEAVAA